MLIQRLEHEKIGFRLADQKHDEAFRQVAKRLVNKLEKA